MRLIKDRSVYRRIARRMACGTMVRAGTSQAGSAAGSDAELATGASDSGLQEITVTAQRRSEDLQ